MTICVIPARGGSKGIPRKNIVQVAGKPLVAWSIEQALAAEKVDKVIVTTDDDEIDHIARSHGADTFRRQPITATDTAPSEMAIAEVLEHHTGHDVCVFLQATSPIRQPGDIDACVEQVEHYGDSLFSYRKVEGYTWSQSGKLTPCYTVREPRQYWHAETLEENGSIYVFRTAGFMQHQNRLFGKVLGYEMHPLDSFQIDEPQDVQLLEQLLYTRLPHDCRIAAAN